MTDRRTGYSIVRRDSTPATDAEDAEDVREFGKHVHVQYRGLRLGVPVALIASIAGSVGTYYATHATPADCASKGDMNAISKKVDELSASQATLAQTVAKNADAAHNETQELRSTVTRNSDRTEGAIGRLSDKLDVFLRR